MKYQIPQHLQRKPLDTQNQMRLERYRQKLAETGRHPIDLAGFPAWPEAEYRGVRSMATKIVRPNIGGVA